MIITEINSIAKVIIYGISAKCHICQFGIIEKLQCQFGIE